MASLKDRIQAEFASVTDSFANLVKSFTIADEQIDSGKVQVPGELPELFAQKLVLACQNLLELSHDLKRTALLNDAAGRNSQVLLERRNIGAEMARIPSDGVAQDVALAGPVASTGSEEDLDDLVDQVDTVEDMEEEL